MPNTVSIDQDSLLIQLTWTDIVSVEELMEYERAYWQGNLLLGYNHCVDFRQCLLDIEFSELFALAAQTTPSGQANYKGARTALIVADDVQEELAEFYREARHQVCDPAIREVRVFRELDLAMDWIAEAVVVF